MSVEEKIRQLATMLTECSENGFTGNIQVNFLNGGITNINRNESIRL